MENKPRHGQKVRIHSSILFALALTPMLGNAQAEEKTVSGNHSIVQMLTRTVGTVELKAGHEFALQARNDRLTSSNPDFNLECAMVNIDDHISFNGKHFGAAKCRHASGDIAFYRFEGTYRSTSSKDGSWESAWQGKLSWQGGTGRFKNLVGDGTYQGHRTSVHEGESTWSAKVSY